MGAARLAVLCTALAVLVCAPAHAQEEENRDATIVDCSQVQNVFAGGQYGNAAANAQYDGEAIAAVAQELDISQVQVNNCLVDLGAGGDGNGEDNGTGGDGEGEGDGSDEEDGGSVSDEDDVITRTIVDGNLPETGGPPLLALVGGLALILAAVLARR